MFDLSSLPIPVRTITDWSQVPGSNTYFRTSDVTPYIDKDGTLVVYDAKGVRRSWGTPKVDSSVRKLSNDVIQITVTGWHKHTVRPVGGTFYFVCENGKWVRRTAASKAVKAALAS